MHVLGRLVRLMTDGCACSFDLCRYRAVAQSYEVLAHRAATYRPSVSLVAVIEEGTMLERLHKRGSYFSDVHHSSNKTPPVNLDHFLLV
jgi:hypothetical protein